MTDTLSQIVAVLVVVAAAVELDRVIEVTVDIADNFLMDPNTCKSQCHKFKNCLSP